MAATTGMVAAADTKGKDMKLTVLVEDSILKHKQLLAEHGLSFYIEVDGQKILFDVGESDIFIHNAKKLGIDLSDLDYIVLSHGHYDHTCGLKHYIEQIAPITVKKPILLTHPDSFLPKMEEERGNIGMNVSKAELEKYFEVKTTVEPYKISESLIFLGQIPRKNDFEAQEPICHIEKDGALHDDFCQEDSALVYQSDDAISIITGCSHSGICNIVDYAVELCGKKKISAIIGGFHLCETPCDVLQKIISHLKKYYIDTIYPCHCTDFGAKVAFAQNFKLKNIGTGCNFVN